MFRRYKLDIITVVLPTDLAHKVTVEETDKMDRSSKFHLDPDIFKRSETRYQHKHECANATLENAAAFDSGQTKLIQCQFPVGHFDLFVCDITWTSKSEYLYIWNPKDQKSSRCTY